MHGPRLPDETAETHMTRWASLLTAGQNTSSHMVTTFTLPAISHGVDTLHGSRREIRKGKKRFIFAQKYDVASEPEEGTGLAMSWTSLQSLEVGAGSGSMSGL